MSSLATSRLGAFACNPGPTKTKRKDAKPLSRKGICGREKEKQKGRETMTENEIAKIVVDAAYCIHKHFGPGLHETVYEVCLVHELRKRGLRADRQKAVAVKYDSITFEEGFRADVVVDDRVVLELKAVEKIHPVHKKQLLTYLRLTDTRLGLLINFDSPLIKDGISRVVNGLPEDQ